MHSDGFVHLDAREPQLVHGRLELAGAEPVTREREEAVLPRDLSRKKVGPRASGGEPTLFPAERGLDLIDLEAVVRRERRDLFSGAEPLRDLFRGDPGVRDHEPAGRAKRVDLDGARLGRRLA